MSLEKICEYLNDIGILESDNVNKFLSIYSKLSSEEYQSNIDKIKQTLCIYIKNIFIKNDKLLILCENIITAFSNYQLILKYRALNSLKNIITTKINLKYNKFIKDISFYILHKNKNQPLKKNLTQNTEKKTNNNRNSNIRKLFKEMNNSVELNQNAVQNKLEDLLSSSDERECTFKPKINKNFKRYNNKRNNINTVQTYIYCSPSVNVPSSIPINCYANNFINSHTIQKIVNEINNENIISNNNNYFSQVLTNNENTIISDNSKNIVIKNNKLFNQQMNNLRLINRISEGTALNIDNNINNNFLYNSTHLNAQKNMNINNILTNVVGNHYSSSDRDDLCNKELQNFQNINNKLKQNINSNNKYIREASIQPSLTKKNNENFFIENPFQNFDVQKINNIPVSRTTSAINKPKKIIKVIEDSSLVQQRKTEKTKQLMKKSNFAPKTKSNKMTDLKKKLQKSKFNKMKNIIEENLHSARKISENNKSNVVNNFTKDYFNLKEDELVCNPVITKENLNNKNIQEIENNKLAMMDKILKEHKIGFKTKIENEISDLQNSERLKNDNKKNDVENDGKNIINIEKKNDEIKEDICDNDIQSDEYSFKNCKFQSNALKSLLNNCTK